MDINEFDENYYDMPCEKAWCPGCGHFTAQKILRQALAELKIPNKKLVFVSGIGQAAKLPQYTKGHMFNGLHGRSLPAAMAIKACNPELTVIVNSGDGCSYGEGGNHFLAQIARNADITQIVHNNMIYGLTKGQASPTSLKGMKTPVQVGGVTNEPFNPLAVAIAMGASFVARIFAGNMVQAKKIIKQAIQHKGYALVDTLVQCVSMNKLNTFKWYKENTYELDDSHDFHDQKAAFSKALETGKYPTGIFYKVDGNPTFSEASVAYKTDKSPLYSRDLDMKKLEKLIISKEKAIKMSEPDENEFKDYYGTLLHEEEYNFLKSLESKTGSQIPSLQNLNRTMYGFIAKKGRVLALALQGQSLEIIPDNIGDLKSLNYLWLANNKLINLPQNLTKLKAFSQLHIQNNRFVNIPDWFKNFQLLKALNIGRNPLKKIPSWISEIKNLEHLYLFGLELLEIPEWVKSMTQLTRLVLYKNELVKIPSWISELENLRELTLGDNHISELPSEIGNLKNLIELSLYRNNLSTLPDSYKNLINLQDLNIFGNKLTRLPEWFGSFKKLTNLIISNNNLSEFPTSIIELKNLRTFWLEDNNWKVFNKEIKNWIEELKTNGCRIKISK